MTPETAIQPFAEVAITADSVQTACENRHFYFRRDHIETVFAREFAESQRALERTRREEHNRIIREIQKYEAGITDGVTP